jgi:hypothetical protein
VTDEGELDDLYWRLSFYELVGRIKLRIGEHTAILLSQFAGMAQIVNGAFGGETPAVDLTEGAASAEDAVAAINAALSFG